MDYNYCPRCGAKLRWVDAYELYSCDDCDLEIDPETGRVEDVSEERIDEALHGW